MLELYSLQATSIAIITIQLKWYWATLVTLLTRHAPDYTNVVLAIALQSITHFCDHCWYGKPIAYCRYLSSCIAVYPWCYWNRWDSVWYLATIYNRNLLVTQSFESWNITLNVSLSKLNFKIISSLSRQGVQRYQDVYQIT